MDFVLQDLIALGLRGTPLGSSPATLQPSSSPSLVFYDTMAHPDFQGKGGTARSLKCVNSAICCVVCIVVHVLLNVHEPYGML